MLEVPFLLRHPEWSVAIQWVRAGVGRDIELAFDAVLIRAEEGAAWTIRYPQFNLVTPSPVLIVPFAYSVAQGEQELLAFLDAWLVNARGTGTVDELYRYWMLGQVQQTKPPRWSVARDVLGWID